jgi:hypothetical protein
VQRIGEIRANAVVDSYDSVLCVLARSVDRSNWSFQGLPVSGGF